MKIKIISIITILLFLTVGMAAAVSHNDGTYVGKAEDMQGTCVVQLKIKKSAISRIVIKEGRSDIDMSDEQLREWLGAVIAKQELDAVDAVSGATMSCDLLKKAIFDALKQAEK